MSQIIRKTTVMLDHLNKCSALSGVKDQTIRKIYREGILRLFSRGETVVHAREVFPFICFLLTGKVIQYNLTHLGKRKILLVFGAGTLLNNHIFDNQPSTTYCDTLDNCVILMISKDKMHELMEEDFSLVQGLMRSQERKMHRLQHQVINSVGNIHLERKLAAKLWKLARDFGIKTEEGVVVDMRISVTFLADMLGTPRETASRLVRDLTQYGLIRHDNKRVLVCDMDSLAHFFKTGIYKG